MHDCTYERIEKLRAVLFVLFFSFPPAPLSFFCKQTIQHEILIKIHFLYLLLFFFLFLLISTPDTYTYIWCRIQGFELIRQNFEHFSNAYVFGFEHNSITSKIYFLIKKNKTFTSWLRKIVGRRNSSRSRILSNICEYFLKKNIYILDKNIDYEKLDSTGFDI